MTAPEWETADSRDFEAMLEGGIPAPLEDIVAEVTPWKRSMGRVLAGMALTAVTFRFWGLNYILPAIGVVLKLLGFRVLRRENRWFKICFVTSVLQTALVFSLLILYTTILFHGEYGSILSEVLTAVSMALLFTELVCFRRGILSVQKKAGCPPHARGAAALIVWYGLLYLLALAPYTGWIIPAGMAAGYGLILFSLWRLSKALQDAGYAIHAAPVKVSDPWIAAALALSLLAGAVCGYAFGGSYPMKWARLEEPTGGEVQQIKTWLLGLGFPEEVLDDICPEDIAACEGALRVVALTRDHPVDDGTELRITGVAVQLPGSPERWMLFHHFLWTMDPGFYGTEAIRLFPASYESGGGWLPAGKLTGRVLYDRDGETFAADYYSLGMQTYSAPSLFWGQQQYTTVLAEFSLPEDGLRQRGYIAYSITEAREGVMLSSLIDYVHQKSWFQYPVRTAAEYVKNYSGWSNRWVFWPVQDGINFLPEDDSIKPFG